MFEQGSFVRQCVTKKKYTLENIVVHIVKCKFFCVIYANSIPTSIKKSVASQMQNEMPT